MPAGARRVCHFSYFLRCQPGSYYWLDARRVLVLSSTIGIAGQEPPDFTWDKPLVVDTGKNAVVQLDHLQHMWAQYLGHGRVSSGQRSWFSESLNRRFTAWCASTISEDRGSSVGCALDGKVWNAVANSIVQGSCWARDSLHMFKVDWTSRTPAVVQFGIGLRDMVTTPLRYPVGRYVMFSTPQLLGELPTGQLLAVEKHWEQFKWNLVRIDRTAGAAIWSVRAVKPPAGNPYLGEVILSPQGTRLMWVVYFKDHGGSTCIYASRTDGSERKQVAVIPNLKGDSSGDSVAGWFQWLPDGKSVSFVYGNGLYVMPVPNG